MNGVGLVYISLGFLSVLFHSLYDDRKSSSIHSSKIPPMVAVGFLCPLLGGICLISPLAGNGYIWQMYSTMKYERGYI